MHISKSTILRVNLLPYKMHIHIWVCMYIHTLEIYIKLLNIHNYPMSLSIISTSHWMKKLGQSN